MAQKILSTAVAVLFIAIINIAQAGSHQHFYYNNNGYTNYIQSGSITSINGELTCGSLKCAPNSSKCSVFRKSTDDLAYVQTLVRCFDANGQVSQQSDTHANNPAPQRVREYTEAEAYGGNFFQCNDCQGDTPEEIKEIQSRNAAEFAENMSEFGANLSNSLSHLGRDINRNVHRQLKHSFDRAFGPGFPFNR